MSAGIVTVFGNGKIEENFPDYQKAKQLGHMLAQNGYTVCTGGYGGIMEAAARGAKEAGGKTIGVTVGAWNAHANRWIDQEEKMPGWRERLFRLMDHAEAGCVLFDGGTGTLAELFVVWEMANKKMIQKPIILFGSFLSSVLEFLRHQKSVQFNDFLKLANSPDAVIDFLKA